MIKAVLWDFGGVITTSPFEAFNRYETERGLPLDFIRSVNATNPENNAWAQLEQNRVGLAEFDRLFASETAAAGHEVPGADVLRLLSGDIRPHMVTALKCIKQHYRVACITNNVQVAGSGPGMASDHSKAQAVGDVLALFEFVLESSVVGVRKPDPRIYEMACEQLGVAPQHALFLDDLGVNLKPARAMGMTTIKVLSQAQTLQALSETLNMPELAQLS